MLTTEHSSNPHSVPLIPSKMGLINGTKNKIEKRSGSSFLIRRWYEREFEINLCKSAAETIWSFLFFVISISSGLSLKHIPIIIGKFVLAIHLIGEGYQISAFSVVSTKP